MKSTLVNNPSAYCVIMAGGIGSRFWPVSRAGKPKQFLDILGTGRTMLEETCDRFEGIVPFDNFLVMTGEQFQEQVLNLIPSLKPAQVLTEPERRNTAPAIAYAAYRIFKQNPEAVMIVTPSDHFIGDEEAFRNVLNKAIEHASSHDELVTVGIKPTYPATGYGYIELASDGEGDGGFSKVLRFKEKPDLTEAKELLRKGNYLWNSGMFVWKARTIVDALEKYLPDVAVHFAEIREFETPTAAERIRDAFKASPAISIDYGVMERADNVSCIAGDFRWDDVGTWTSLHRLQQKMELQDAKCLFGEDSEDTIVRTTFPGKKVVTIGLKDYLVVDTPDILLIAPKEDEKRLHEYLRRYAKETDTE